MTLIFDLLTSFIGIVRTKIWHFVC